MTGEPAIPLSRRRLRAAALARRFRHAAGICINADGRRFLMGSRAHSLMIIAAPGQMITPCEAAHISTYYGSHYPGIHEKAPLSPSSLLISLRRLLPDRSNHCRAAASCLEASLSPHGSSYRSFAHAISAASSSAIFTVRARVRCATPKY